MINIFNRKAALAGRFFSNVAGAAFYRIKALIRPTDAGVTPGKFRYS